MIKKNKSNIKLLSVIIPALNAEKFIDQNIKEVEVVLKQLIPDYEVIIVDDGSKDNTFKVAKGQAKNNKRVKVFGYKINKGKGHAVQYGMSKAKGDIIGFIDAGFDLNPEGMFMLLEHFRWYNADVIVGSKKHPASKVVYPLTRRVLSFGYQMISRLLFGLKVKDTQVGMKFFRKEVVRDLLPRLLVKRFAFDIEMLSVANYLGYKRIYEAPVDLRVDMEGLSTISSFGYLNTVFNMFWDTAAVFYRLRIINYYDENNKDKWLVPEYKNLEKKK